MRALFGRKNRNIYPDHLADLPEIDHPYYPKPRIELQNAAKSDLSVEMPRQNHGGHRKTGSYGPARTTLDALQIIRRRFEETAKTDSVSDQAAA